MTPLHLILIIAGLIIACKIPGRVYVDDVLPAIILVVVLGISLPGVIIGPLLFPGVYRAIAQGLVEILSVISYFFHMFF
jgi:hypothetical protein